MGPWGPGAVGAWKPWMDGALNQSPSLSGSLGFLSRAPARHDEGRVAAAAPMLLLSEGVRAPTS